MTVLIPSSPSSSSSQTHTPGWVMTPPLSTSFTRINMVSLAIRCWVAPSSVCWLTCHRNNTESDAAI